MRNKLVVTLILAAIGGGAGALVLRSSTSKAAAQASSTPPSATPQLIVAAGRTEPASEEIDVSTELDGRLRRGERRDEFAAGQVEAVFHARTHGASSERSGRIARSVEHAHGHALEDGGDGREQIGGSGTQWHARLRCWR